MCLFIYLFFLSTFSWLLIRWYPPALCTCSCSPCFNEFAVLMNLGHISHYFRPLCQGCDRPYYALPFDDILYDVSCTCIVDYLVLIFYNFDNKHTFIVIVIVIVRQSYITGNEAVKKPDQKGKLTNKSVIRFSLEVQLYIQVNTGWKQFPKRTGTAMVLLCYCHCCYIHVCQVIEISYEIA